MRKAMITALFLSVMALIIALPSSSMAWYGGGYGYGSGCGYYGYPSSYYGGYGMGYYGSPSYYYGGYYGGRGWKKFRRGRYGGRGYYGRGRW